MSSKPPINRVDDLFDFPPYQQYVAANASTYNPNKMIFQEELFEDYYQRSSGIPTLSISIEQFVGDNLRNMPKLREALYFARKAHAEQIDIFVSHYGPIPIKLQKWHGNRFKDMAFEWVVNAPPGIQADFLERIDDYIWDYAPAYDQDNPNGIETEQLRQHLGVTELSEQQVTDVNEILEGIHRFAISREILDRSQPVQWLKQNGHTFTYERAGDRCILVVQDPKTALYMKLSY